MIVQVSMVCMYIVHLINLCKSQIIIENDQDCKRIRCGWMFSFSFRGPLRKRSFLQNSPMGKPSFWTSCTFNQIRHIPSSRGISCLSEITSKCLLPGPGVSKLLDPINRSSKEVTWANFFQATEVLTVLFRKIGLQYIQS